MILWLNLNVSSPQFGILHTWTSLDRPYYGKSSHLSCIISRRYGCLLIFFISVPFLNIMTIFRWSIYQWRNIQFNRCPLEYLFDPYLYVRSSWETFESTTLKLISHQVPNDLMLDLDSRVINTMSFKKTDVTSYLTY